jgi:hypothetical protein
MCLDLLLEEKPRKKYWWKVFIEVEITPGHKELVSEIFRNHKKYIIQGKWLDERDYRQASEDYVYYTVHGWRMAKKYEKGFHCFRYLKDAIIWAGRDCGDYGSVIKKVEVKDMVAYGTQDSAENFKVGVFKKIKVLE